MWGLVQSFLVIKQRVLLMLARQFPPWAFLIAAVVPILLVAFLGGLLPKPVIMTLSGLAVLWGGAMTTLHWKRLDEAARSAHRWA